MQSRTTVGRHEFQSLVDLLLARASDSRISTGYTFLADGSVEAGQLSFSVLDARARAIGAQLQRTAAPGDRAMLLFPPGLDFITAFFGCLYAGVVAVPAYPPRPRRGNDRLKAIVDDARPAFALTNLKILDRSAVLVQEIPALRAARWISVESVPAERAEEWQKPELNGGSIAFLQYTSGSTSLPKGVIVSHGNLLHNEWMIRQACDHTEESTFVGWLPLYHDMGLIGNVLQPLYLGSRCVLMSPASFLRSPLRWLEAISQYRAYTSGGPNFAYELCVHRVSAEQRATLDLSAWQIAFNGAEPVRWETQQRFAAHFADCGFRPEAFYPCYGLAETTLFVSGGERIEAVRTLRVAADALEDHRVVPNTGEDVASRQLVSCGTVQGGQRVVIAGPLTGAGCAAGEVGEIWVQGPSVGQGYWDRPEETERTFCAVLAGAESKGGTYLRTGDLGFLHDGELYVTGRLKDLIIVRGRNHYPQDIELSAERSHAALRPGCSAAFSIEVNGEERLVITAERQRHSRASVESIAGAVRRAIAGQHQVQVHAVLLLGIGSILKTSSGKIQRQACRAAFLADRFEPLGSSFLATGESFSEEIELDVGELPGLPTEQRRVLLETFLRQRVARLLRIEPEQLDSGASLGELGLDSLATVELQNLLQSEFGASPTLIELLEQASLHQLTDRVLEVLDQTPGPEAATSDQGTAIEGGSEIEAKGPPLLSAGQRSLWFLQQLEPASAANHLAFAVRIAGSVDVGALRRSLQNLVDRHTALRTTFRAVAGEPIRVVHEQLEVGWLEEDASDLDSAELDALLVATAARPFDLEQGPILRVALFERATGDRLLLWVVHHIAMDFWSAVVLLAELRQIYPAMAMQTLLQLPAVEAQYADFVRWQENLLAGPRGEQLWEYWREQLLPAAPELELPTDRPRRTPREASGAACALYLGTELSDRLNGLAREQGTTLYTVLLTAFELLLHRLSGQADLVVGSALAGRSQARFASTVGYLMNALPMRSRLVGAPAFAELLGDTRRVVLAALEHQDFPSHLLTERLQVGRESAPGALFRVFLTLNKSHLEGERELAEIALGEARGTIDLGGLELESYPLIERPAPFDLHLMLAADATGELAGSLLFSQELFDRATATRWVGQLRTLLAAVVEAPDRSSSALSLLSAAERHQLEVEWSLGEPRPAAAPVAVHRLIEAAATRTPDVVAVQQGDLQLTYSELETRANRLARWLRELGVEAEQRVAVLMPRQPDVIVALLAVLKAGGAYLPLDPGQPAERLALILTDSGVRAVVTTSELAGLLTGKTPPVIALDVGDARLARYSPSPLPDLTPLDALAYIIYTSGSTGRPKGVLISHRSLATYTATAVSSYGLTAGDRALQFASVSFDASAEEIYPCLCQGATLVLRTEEMLSSTAIFLAQCGHSGITVLNLPTAYWHELAADLSRLELEIPDSVRLVIIGGERALPVPLAEWRRRAPRRMRLVNTYGPTEATIVALGCQLLPVAAGWSERAEIPIGRPVRGVRAHVLGRRFESLPIGSAGQLLLAGTGLARGYGRRPGLTAEHFVPDPWGEEVGARLYQTGDLARFRSDGLLEFVGRCDLQVKVRGFRIEPGEIEAVLMEHPAVLACAVVAFSRPPADSRLAAYLRAVGEPPSVGELRGWLGDRLPSYMIPAVFVPLAELPQLPSGKVDRRRLPEPSGLQAHLAVAYEAPRTPQEEVLASLCGELLGAERLGRHDDFFELGCHSLLATQIVARTRDAFQVEVPVQVLFEAPTVAGLAQRLSALETDGQSVVPPIEAAPRPASIPLSFVQERLWFLNQLDPASASYHVPRALRIDGDLRIDLLERTYSEVVRRHEILRTRFPVVDGRPVQVVEPSRPVHLPRVDLTALRPAGREQEVARQLAAQGRQPFDLANGPLLRLFLLLLGGDEHMLVQTEHHLVHDGWTQAVLAGEIMALYRAFYKGEPSPLAPLRVQYADFALWQRRWLRDEVLEPQLTFWQERLAGAPALLELPTDRPRPRIASYRGHQLEVDIPGHLATTLRELSRRFGGTLFMTLLTTFKALLYRYSGQRDLLVGTGIANRRVQEIEQLIGMVINTLVLRSRIESAATFEQHFEQLRGVCLEAYAHQDLPFERVVDALKVQRTLSHNPVFQVMLAFMDAPMPALELPGLVLEGVFAHNRSSKFDLNVTVIPHAEQRVGRATAVDDSEVRLLWEYSGDLFDRSTMQRMLGHYLRLLEGVVAEPHRRLDDLPLMAPAERHQLLEEWANVQPAVGGPCLHQRFELQVERSPESVAVSLGESTLTYRQLNSRVNQLAHRLRRLGVGLETPVALCLERSLDMVVGMLAVLKAGGAYVPLDPTLPAQRLAFVIEDCAAPLILSSSTLVGTLSEVGGQVLLLDASDHGLDEERTTNPAPIAEPLARAYVIYTSGSTGLPKGVSVSHRNVERLFAACEDFFRFSAGDVWTLFHSYAFDFSVWELWGALLYGGRLVVVPDWLRRSPEEFYRLLVDEGVTVLNQTPSSFVQLSRAEEELDRGDELALRWVIFGGEALELASLEPWFVRHGDRRPQLVNMYGITETTVHVTLRPLSAPDLDGGSVIGRPLADLQLWVLDHRQRPVPLGVPGELSVGGGGLARGYLGRPRLTAERFVPNSHSTATGDRLYRSGDLGRLRSDGDLEYLGRIDRQVQLRGFRIELGEIEAALTRHSAVQQAVVQTRGSGTDQILVGYLLVPASEAAPTVEELRRFLQRSLPDYMVPAAFVTLDAFPLTSSGKVDLRSLPAPESERPELERLFVEPRSAEERVLAEIWSSVLGVEQVGVHDSFFSLGGDSIRSIQVRGLAAGRGLSFTVQQLFEHQTIAELATVAESATQDRGGQAPFALVSAQDRLLLDEDLEDAYPLTRLQAGMLFESAYRPESLAYHNVTSLHLAAPLDVEALQGAVDQLIRRHAVLRSSFDFDRFGSPLQLVHSTVAVPVEFEDLSELTDADQKARLASFFDTETEQRFDPAQPPLIRFRVHKRNAERFQLSFAEHHAILDGWSMARLLSELFQLYFAGLGEDLPAVEELGELAFGDYVARERETVRAAESREFWRGALADFECRRLATRGSHATAPREWQFGVEEVCLPSQLSEQLEVLAQSLGAPLKSVLLAAHLRILSLLTGSAEVATGLVTNGRLEQAGGDKILGLFLNTVPLRLRLTGGSWRELVLDCLAAEQQMRPHRRFPLADIQQLTPTQPLFEVVFNYVHFHAYDSLSMLDRVEVLDRQFVAANHFTLTANFGKESDSGRVVLRLEYDPAVLAPARVSAIAKRYQLALSNLAERSDTRYSGDSLLSRTERQQVLVEWNGAVVDHLEPPTLHHAVAAQARRSPQAIALIRGAEKLSFAELDCRANQLAHYLRRQGVGEEARVGLCVERSLSMVVGMLAILKAGGAYLPLDPDYPRDRLAFMLTDARATLLLTEAARRDEFPEFAGAAVCLDQIAAELANEPSIAPPSAAERDLLAYVIYTSGSSGRPKGVMVSHGAIMNRLSWMQRVLPLRPTDRVLHKTPYSFDASIWEIFVPLISGARAVLAEPGGHRDSAYLVAAVSEYQITVLQLVPSMLAVLLEEPAFGAGCQSLRRLFCGGEALPTELTERAAAELPETELFNLYGPTETAIDAAWMPCARVSWQGVMPIGRPLDNLRIRLLDHWQQPAPTGVAAELMVGGASLARGYDHKPGLTAERFGPDPLGPPGARLYRTGDLARRTADGLLEFLGRLDQQTKVRGVRVEPGEIEAEIQQIPGVSQAVVEPVGEGPMERRLVAYWVASDTAEVPSVAELRGYLKARLPDAMVPTYFVLLEELPLKPNGKLDRSALPSPEDGVGSDHSYVVPTGPVEEILAGIWEEVLGAERVGSSDDFFELGGHSLLATQVVSRIRQVLAVELPLRQLFDQPTIAELARYLARLDRDDNRVSLPAIERRAGRQETLLSYAQERLWILDRLESDRASYNVPLAIELRGGLDVAALERALFEVERRHQILRSRFVQPDGHPRQVVVESRASRLPVLDLVLLPVEARNRRARQEAVTEARQAFDLASGPLWRARLLRLAEDRHLALLTLHHIVADGWSMGVLIRELGAIYGALVAGRPPVLDELPIQYADYAAWQRQWLSSAALEAELDYWCRQLADPPALELATDRPRRRSASSRGGRQPVRIGAGLSRQLAALSRRQGVSSFMTLLAGFETLLHRYTGQRDVLVGTPVANRDRVEVEGLIGCFLNTLVLRGRPTARTRFGELLAATREVTLDAFAHQDLPFERLVETLQPDRDLGSTPLFRVMFILQNAHREELRLADLEAEEWTIDRRLALYDLTLVLGDEDRGLSGAIEYRSDLFDPTTVGRMASHLVQLLSAAVAEPTCELASLPMLAPAEQHQVRCEWNDTATARPLPGRAEQLIAEQARRQGEVVAVECGDRQLTYAELAEQARGLAGQLRALGVVPGSRIAVCIGRSPELAVALLGILEAGAAFVPLDPAYPRQRLRFMVEHSGAVFLLGDRQLPEGMQELGVPILELEAAGRQSTEAIPAVPARAVASADLAYVIYTSGSTGQPKGSLIGHRALAGFTVDMAARLELEVGDRFLQFAALGFDVLIEELFPAWSRGATVVFEQPESLASIGGFCDLLERHAITCVELPTAFWHAWVDELEASGQALPESLRLVLVGGEDTSPARLAAWARLGVELVNVYGLTETTVTSTLHRATFATLEGEPRPLPIGRPIGNTAVRLLTPALRLQPAGVIGEICISGDGVGTGYLVAPRSTAERFVPDPFSRRPGGRLYRTGDLARMRGDGEFEFRGRIDQQVKVSGFRIEPAEIEQALISHPAIREAAVVAHEDRSGARRLVAYLETTERVAQKAGELEPGNLRRFLEDALPAHMIPALFVELEALPLTAHGKTDYRALPIPKRSQSSAETPSALPTTPAQQRLAKLWTEVLGGGSPTLDDHFFELGGHSLLATQLIARASREFGLEIPLRAVFEGPTLAALAATVERLKAGGSQLASVPLRRIRRDGELPLSFGQQRLWFLDQLNLNRAAFNIAGAFELAGDLDVAAFHRSLATVVERHEVLRTRFESLRGRPRQVIDTEVRFRLPLVDLSRLPRSRRDVEVLKLAAGDGRRPFDLGRAPLLRSSLLRLARHRHVVLSAMHHIASDAWSMKVLMAELQACYEAFSHRRSVALRRLPIQYADFAHWQHEGLRSALLEDQLAAWKRRLAGIPTTLELPFDRPRSMTQSFRGACHGLSLPSARAEALKALGQSAGATLFSTLLTVFQILLSWFSGERDVPIGAPVANRRQVELEGLIGFFANILVLRCDLSGNPDLHQLLTRTQEVVLEAQANQDLPFDRLVDELKIDRDLRHNPLVQVALTFDTAPAEPASRSGLRLTPLKTTAEITQWDLNLNLTESSQGLVGWLQYSTDLFEAATISRLADGFDALVELFIEHPASELQDAFGKLSVLEAGSRQARRAQRQVGLRRKLRAKQGGVGSAS